MEQNTPNPDENSELIRKLQALEGLPAEEKGFSKKKKIQMVVAAIAAMLFLAVVFFLMGNKGPEKGSKAIPAINRGLSQAESIRKQKEMFDQKSKTKNRMEDDWTRKTQVIRENPAPADSPVFAPEPVAMGSDGKSSTDPGPVIPAENEEGVKLPRHEDLTSVLFSKHGVLSHNKSKPSLSSGKDYGGSGGGVVGEISAPPVEKPIEFKPKPELAARLTEDYQKALAYLSSEQLVFTRERGGESQKEKGGVKGLPAALAKGSTHVIISAGQELTAVLNESVNSDYPSVAKATLNSPAELSGATVLLSYNLGNERVTAQIMKMVLPAKEGEKAKEVTLSAVVKSGLPGLAGDVSHHWTAQIASGLASAGLTAGALAYASQNSSKDLGTAVLVAPMVEQSVQGILKPVNYLGRDRPVTVTVPAGTEFTVLVTEGFEVDL